MRTYPGFDEEVRGEELSRGSIYQQAAVLVELDKHASLLTVVKLADEDLLLREQLVVVVAGAEEEVALLVGGHE